MTDAPVFRAKFINAVADVPLAVLMRNGPFVFLVVYLTDPKFVLLFFIYSFFIQRLKFHS